MSNQKKAYLYAITVVAIWATVASAFKISLRYVTFLQLLFFASLFSLVVLFITIIIQKKQQRLKQCSKREYLRSCLLGILNPFLYYMVLFKAYSLLPAQEAQPLNQTWAIVLSILSIIILKQKISLKNIGALMISFFGVIAISTQGNILSFKFTHATGALLALGSAWIWSIYWIYNLKDRRDEVIKLFLNFLFGTIFIFIFMILTKKLTLPGSAGLIGALYVGIFEMGITFVLWLKALKLSKTAAQVSNVIYLVPFLSLIVIHFTVGEKILFSTIIGLVFIISGIILQQYYSTNLWQRQ
jgi:drug/metabolite transporter (DMT)-like permease